jgi:hypothetical protein
MNALTTPKGFIARGRMHKVFIIISHTSQVTQAMNLPETKPKLFFYIGCDQLTPSMVVIFSIHALHLGTVVSSQNHWQQFKQDIPIESNWKELDF